MTDIKAAKEALDRITQYCPSHVDQLEKFEMDQISADIATIRRVLDMADTRVDSDAQNAIEELRFYLDEHPIVTDPEDDYYREVREPIEIIINQVRSYHRALCAALSTQRKLKKIIAEAAICVFEGKSGINDTVWLDDHSTLYEHLVAPLNIELTGEYEHDLKVKQEYVDALQPAEKDSE